MLAEIIIPCVPAKLALNSSLPDRPNARSDSFDRNTIPRSEIADKRTAFHTIDPATSYLSYQAQRPYHAS